MDKQQADHIDNKIRQAADHSHPPFKEEAWQRMEVKLDKEFNKRRRGLVWWWVFGLLMIGGGAGFYIFQQKYNGSQLTNRPSPVSTVQSGQKSGTVPGQKKTAVSTRTGTLQKQELRLKNLKNPGHTLNNTLATEHIPQLKTKQATAKPEDLARTQKINKPAYVDNEIEVTSPPVELLAKEPTGNLEMALTVKGQDADSLNKAGSGEPPQPVVQKIRSDSITVGAPKEQTKKNTSRFYIIASIASDATALSGFTINRAKTLFGAGFGYRVFKNWNLQTGVYAGKKIYEAGPGDYYVKPGSYLSMVDIIKVGADCYIFEIPVSVRYDILSGRKFNFYSVAGLSSLIMQRETYDYHYTSNGAYHQMVATYNGNVHLFSLLNLSAGYEQQIFKSFYLQAEPYIKVPLSGVGEGKVRLYSAGIQFGIKYQPIKKRSGY